MLMAKLAYAAKLLARVDLSNGVVRVAEYKETSAEEKNESDYAFKSVIKKDMTNRRTISVVSLILAVLSVLFFRIPWVGLILAILSVGGAGWSRKNLGYFDKISLAAIIVGIFGVVFALCGIIFAEILSAIF